MGDDRAKIAVVICNGWWSQTMIRPMLGSIIPGNEGALGRQMLKDLGPDVYCRTMAVSHDQDIGSVPNDMIADSSPIEAV